MDKFKGYLTLRTENKARQIIDTSINHLRNTAKLQAMAKAQVKKYRWDAVGDRLTCPYCRSLDGRIFETKEAIRQLELIETDPQALPQVKPFITTMKLEQLKTTPSSKILCRFPPSHPNCRCKVVAYIEEIEEPYPIVITRAHSSTAESEPIFRELEAELSALSDREKTERIKAHLGSDWRRGSKGVYELWETEEERESSRFWRHFRKHAKKLGISTPEEYEKLTYEVIKNPDKVFIQRTLDLKTGKYETDYIFVKGRKIVVSSDEFLGIKTFHLLEERYNSIEERFVEDAKKRREREQATATVRLL